MHAVRHAARYIESLDDAPVATTTDVADLRARLAKQLRADGVDARDVIEQLVADAADGIVGSAGGRYFALVTGGAGAAALGADWLAGAWDQTPPSRRTAPPPQSWRRSSARGPRRSSDFPPARVSR